VVDHGNASLSVVGIVGHDFAGDAVVAADDGIAELLHVGVGGLQHSGDVLRAALSETIRLCVAPAEIFDAGGGDLVFLENIVQVFSCGNLLV